MRSLFALSLLLLSLCVGLAVAAEPGAEPTSPPDLLRFKNGDRLTGKLIRQDDDVIVFASDTIGGITVPQHSATVIMGNEPNGVPVETLVGIAPIASDTPSEAPKTASPGSGANPSGSPPAKPRTDPDASKAAAKLAESLDGGTEEEEWEGKLEFGLRQQQGRRDVFAVDIRGSADRTIGENDLRAKARLLYGEQDGEVNNNRYDASLQWRRELGERTFAQSLTSYFQDDLKDINRNWEQNLGAGYRLLDKKEHVVNLGAGLTGQYREAVLAESGFFTLVEVFQDYTYQFNKRITLRQNAQAQYSPEGGTRFLSVSNQPSATVGEAENYKIRFNTVLQGRLTRKLSMNLRFEYEYDNAVTPKSARTDQRIISSIGYAF